MPARSDIDPADIPILLPYLMIVEKAGNDFRYRLLGSALVRQLGKDVTGQVVGSQFSNPSQAIEAKRLIYSRVFTGARPVLAAVEFKMSPGAINHVLQLILPLSSNGTEVDMAVSSLVARLDLDIRANFDLMRLPVEIRSVAGFDHAAELEYLCLQWQERRTINLSAHSKLR